MKNMLSTFCKTLQLRGKLNIHSYISTLNFHSSRVSYDSSHVLPSLTKDEEIKIVEVVNKCSIEDFAKYNIRANQLKKLLAYREKNDKFNTFDDLIMSQDVPTLVRLCTSILSGEKTPRKNRLTRTKKSVADPAIDPLAAINIKRVLGLYVWGNRLSWALIDENRVLSGWDSRTFENSSKASLLSLINLIINILSELPQADAYVMESDAYTSLNRLKTAAYAMHLQRQQVIATIITVLKMKHQFNDSKIEGLDNFYMLQADAAAKKYNLRVGSETVSAESLINDILSETPNSINNLSISVKPEINLKHASEDITVRQQLNSVLLITMTFMDSIHKMKSLQTNKNV